jgi:hypothetical protein
MIETYISSIFVGRGRSYIYIWVSKHHSVVYVGMTNSKNGTLGRASQHTHHTTGTLRSRFSQNRGFNMDVVNDFKLLSFALPPKKKFTSIEKSYREAVEWLVQQALIGLAGTFTPTFDVVSYVHSSARRASNGEVKRLANDIVNNFTQVYPTL